MSKEKEENVDLKKLQSKISELEDQVSNNLEEYRKDAAGASKKASEFRNRAKETLDQITSYHSEIESLLTEIKQQSEKLKVSGQVISDQNEESTLKLESIRSELNNLIEQKDFLTDLVQQLNNFFINNSNISERIDDLTEFLERGNEESAKINQVLKSVTDRKKQIDELYFEILGNDIVDEETGEETHIEGQKDKLEKAFNQIQEKVKGYSSEIEAFKDESELKYQNIEAKWEKNFETLENEIRKLLPAALTAGLSSAYSKKKEAEESDLKDRENKFKYAIYGLVFVSLIPFGVATTMLIKGDSLHTTVLSLPRILLSILPLYIPVLWLAYSANRKMKLSKRLIEEYTHKEVLSKTYEGLSSQIDNISDDDISYELRVKLLYNLLNVSSENPGKLISDYNRSDHPVIDAIDKSAKLSSAVDRLEKIPGFNKVTSIMEKRAKKILDKQATKVEEVLDVVSDNIDPE